MSTTTHTRPVAGPDQPRASQLSGAAAALWAALNAHPGATSATLAQTAGLGRSTTTKALRHFEQTGLARRESAAPDGNGRPASHWHPTPTTADEASTPPETQDEPSTDNNDGQEPPAEPNDQATPTTDAPTRSDDSSVDGDRNGIQDDRHRPEAETNPANEPLQGTEVGDSSPPEPAPEPPAGKAVPPVTPEPTQPNSTITSGSKVRLARGALRDMVVDHLTAHRGEAFTATGISRVIEKSSGAIANALVTLAQRGITEQVTERPRTYRLATTPSDDDM
ncbi:MarR family transcriptional regulator [Streptomyces violaceusniger]|uniref:MarR family transcriptional regulator n=1 Tax=Streptomyces violaceusniger TaxID=68280 RepID=UPI00099805AA|nr:MarR family transcriptional regulator [Streptomyces hygroscopicus]AQW48265.1 hypothetical protein SHXM_01728 [Streptomyces hygroscopicus]